MSRFVTMEGAETGLLSHTYSRRVGIKWDDSGRS